jgi:hypothetical protein
MENRHFLAFLNNSELQITYTFNKFDKSNIYFFSMINNVLSLQILTDFCKFLLSINITSKLHQSKTVDKPTNTLDPPIDSSQIGIIMTLDNITALDKYINSKGLNIYLPTYYDKIELAHGIYLSQSDIPSKPTLAGPSKTPEIDTDRKVAELAELLNDDTLNIEFDMDTDKSYNYYILASKEVLGKLINALFANNVKSSAGGPKRIDYTGNPREPTLILTLANVKTLSQVLADKSELMLNFIRKIKAVNPQEPSFIIEKLSVASPVA